MLQKILVKSFLFFLLFPIYLFATEPHGFVKTSTTIGIRGDNRYKFIDNNVRAQINLNQDLGDNGSVSASLDILYEKYMDNSPTIKLIPIEFYAQYSGNWWGIKAGKYYDFWGLFDWISPNDIINPWDMTHISSDIEDYRISVYGINLSAGNDLINFEINLLPIFQPDILPMLPPEEETLPSPRLANTEIATRISGAIESTGVDWDLYFFKGFQKTPSMKTGNPPTIQNLSPVTSTTTKLKLYYQKILMGGMDISYAVSSILLKMEGAYVETEDKNGTNPLAENPFYSIVTGFDWSIMPELTVSAAYKFKRYTVFNDKIDSGLHRNQNIFSINIKYQPKDYFNLQWITLYNKDDNSLFMLPFVSYSLIDDYSLTIGSVLFYGKKDSEFGKLINYSNLFFEIKGSF